MRTFLIASLMLLVTLCASFAVPFSHHQEGHPNAAKVIPPGWRLQPHDGGWRGSRFVSPDGSSWFAAYSLPVVSEPVGKAVIACGGKMWHHIAFEYRPARKRQMDPFVIRASQSIDHAEYDSCEEPHSPTSRVP
jgi:hypothetical protein